MLSGRFGGMATKDIFPSFRGDEEWRGRRDDLAKRYPGEPVHAAFEARIAAEPGRVYHLSPAVVASLDPMSDEERQAFLYALLLWEMDLFDSRAAKIGFPEEIHLHFADSFHRIMDGIEAGTFPFDPHGDLFQKDLAVTRLELIPAVAQLVHFGSGVPLKPLLKWGPSGWAYVWGRCGGRRPFAEIHTHDPMAGTYFNAAGWEETYRLIALLMGRFTEIRGMVGYAWFYDPQLEALSPRLGYLRHSPVNQGARLMPMGPDEDSARLATATSPSRREAYEQGRYIPNRHGVIWSRADMLKHYA